MTYNGPRRGRPRGLRLKPATPSRPRNDAEQLYEKLTSQGTDTPPACDGDDTFTAERADLHPADLTRMRHVCNRCPLLDACRTYADAAKPTAGFWAGSHRGKTSPE
ncbi:WhiB family transcriptional regulator [Microbacterium sp. Leaf151]|uniref:WhiB family transcriptional regulator n=1 Tax=Microbacterium sp. Leaf151 TaxID=1736276 RepID=UPI0006F6E9E9|nr:WhiB family transcriptional regulator [Microbacterium sp. Leaf151]KQR23176.1 hypothetical protein ASF76_08090 [Microbacterium sp. Leaf151]